MTEGKYLIKRLGRCEFESPLSSMMFVGSDERVCIDLSIKKCGCKSGQEPPSFETAGPRKKLFFDPKKTRVGIVSCGGLCPGLNDVIRAVVMVSWYRYGIRDILGIKYGYAGLVSSSEYEPEILTPDIVEDIHKDGGTVLGSSRGPQPVCDIVDFLVDRKIDILFTIGGDGTQHGAVDICEEIEKRGLNISVVGIPKTIDNDIAYTDRTFGFGSAVAAAEGVVRSAHMEAKGVDNGVGLVKLMGRASGFVAAYAAIASSDVNFVLIPEVPFTIDGLMKSLGKRLNRKSHVVIVVAEGAGQDIVKESGFDMSGNKKLGDIGLFLKSAIASHFDMINVPVNVKYIDPSYAIRSVPANADDSVFCFQLAQNSVHAAVSGRTEMVVSLWNNKFVHVPSKLAITRRKKIDVSGMLWQSVLDNTGQPESMV